MSELKETWDYDEMEDTLTVHSRQDIEPYRDQNRAIRNASPEHGAYMGREHGLIYAASIPEGLVLQMRYGQCCPDGGTYDLLSEDPEESRRALLHAQSYHKDILVIHGKPFAKNRVIWE
jgi:hypothetical protein